MTNAEKVLIEKLDRVLENNFDNSSFSIEDICRELGISRSQLYRILKEHFNLSTSLYIRRRRLLKAKELLVSSELKIAEISYKIGIDSPQNFSKYFTQEFGLSPTEYRKNYQQSELGVLQNSIADKPAPKAINTSKRQRKFIYFVTGLGILLLSISGVYFWQTYSRSLSREIPDSNFPTGITDNSIAILPFKNLGDSTTNYFSEGIMEHIHNSLASFDDLKVIATASSNKYLHTQKNIAQIARELGVRFVLEGAVLQIDKQLSITIELINSKDSRVVWAKKYNGDTKDVFTYMSQVAEGIAGELNQKLNNGFAQKLNKIPTKNLSAYNEYLQGRQLMQSRSKEKIQASLLKFTKAIALDPNFAAAYAERATAYFLMADSHYSDIEASIKLSEQNAQNAIKLDAENAIAYSALAHIYRDKNKWKQANDAYLTALKYEPNNALVNYWYSLMLRSTGQLAEAIRYSTKAVSLDPLHPVIFAGHIVNCIYGRKLELAEKSIKDAELLFNDSWVYYWVRGDSYIAKKDYSLALKEFNKARALNPEVKIIEYFIFYCKARLREVREVNNYLASLADKSENYPALAMIYMGLDDKEHALYYLQKKAKTGTIPTDLKVMPIYNILHGDKRFEEILKKFDLSGPIIYPK
ncbi:hypothetical protein GCM10027442_49760 [Emticicia fontis]